MCCVAYYLFVGCRVLCVVSCNGCHLAFFLLCVACCFFFSFSVFCIVPLNVVLCILLWFILCVVTFIVGVYCVLRVGIVICGVL